MGRRITQALYTWAMLNHGIGYRTESYDTGTIVIMVITVLCILFAAGLLVWKHLQSNSEATGSEDPGNPIEEYDSNEDEMDLISPPRSGKPENSDMTVVSVVQPPSLESKLNSDEKTVR